ncbi:MAG TPA: transporter [Xanthobacteraceae bacterium]|nr:transporter [Xanthobacteraceae bacterium]
MSLVAALYCTSAARADEGGVSFWIPGFFGSLAAVPQQAGFAIASIYYHTTVSGGGGIGLSREFQIRNIPAGVSATLNGSVHATGDLGFVFPNYTFATPVFGGQATFGILAAYGNVDTNLNGALAGTATVGGVTVPFMRTDSLSSSVTGFGDLIPMFTLRWNAGVNNYMTYITGDIPVGAYDSMRLSNIGIGHGAIDAGGGYTYFDPKTGREFSAVTGLTYNFTNTATDYRNGLDWHLDWGASQFLTKQLQVGLVGYFYDQLTADQGCLQILCPFKSQVTGIGPQIGYIFPVAGMQGYINLKGYGEFDGHDRPSGWNTWLTFVLSPAPPSAQSSPPPMLTKMPPRS